MKVPIYDRTLGQEFYLIIMLGEPRDEDEELIMLISKHKRHYCFNLHFLNKDSLHIRLLRYSQVTTGP